MSRKSSEILDFSVCASFMSHKSMRFGLFMHFRGHPLCRSKLNGRIYFAGRFFRVFDRGQNNCYFDSAVKDTNMPQNKFLQHHLVLTGTIFEF